MSAGVEVTTTVHAGEVDKLLGSLAIKTADLIPAFRGLIAPSIARHLSEQYESRGAHLGTPWKPISPNTIKARFEVRRASGKKGRRSVTRTGRGKAGPAPMMDTLLSMGSFTKLASPVGIRVYQPLLMEYGSNVAYMAPHHDPQGFDVYPFGNKKAAKVHIAPRFVIPPVWPAVVLAEWEGMLTAYIGGGAPA